MWKIDGATWHWSASGPETTTDDIRRWHKARGWRDIGYQWLILHPASRELKGQTITKWGQLVKRGRHVDDDPWITRDEMAAGARGHNRTRLHLCLIGAPKSPLHPWQKYAMYKTTQVLSKRYGLKPTDWNGHNWLSGHKANQCPGPDANLIIKAIRRDGLEHPDGPGGPIFGIVGGVLR